MNMCITISRRADLDQRQLTYVSIRVLAPEHTNDNGPCKAWNTPGYESVLYAILIDCSPMPIGILYANFLESSLDVGWWVDKGWREMKYSRKATIAFAKILRTEYPNFRYCPPW